MPSTRPFISFLFGSLTQASTGTSTPGPNTAGPGHSVLQRHNGATSPGVTSSQTQQAQQRPQNSPLPHNKPMDVPGNSERRNSASSVSPVGSASDKWWIGGRSSDGNERYYRLQPPSRNKSFDRISLDQLSI